MPTSLQITEHIRLSEPLSAHPRPPTHAQTYPEAVALVQVLHPLLHVLHHQACNLAHVRAAKLVEHHLLVKPAAWSRQAGRIACYAQCVQLEVTGASGSPGLPQFTRNLHQVPVHASASLH